MLELICKFGLEYCDLPTMMWNVAIMLRLVSLDIDSKHKSGNLATSIYYLLTIVSAACYFYVYLVSMIWFVFWRCMETGNNLDALIVFSLGTASEIGPVKLIYMIIHTKQARNIVATCLASDSLVVPGSRFSKNLVKTLRQVKRRAVVFWLILMGNGLLYVVKPLVMPGRHLMDDAFIYLGLEPMYESPNYEIALIVTILGVMFTCYSTANISAFMIVNTGYVEAQMLSWSEELLSLWDDADQHYFENKTQSIANEEGEAIDLAEYKIKLSVMNEFIQSRLKDVIRGHARNLDLLQQIEAVYRGAIALEFFFLIGGLVAELLGGLENTYMELPFSFIQVAMDCLTGQRLTDASEVFERAVFSCRWENFDNSNMKLVLLILQNSQKPMRLSAGGLAILNFSSLMSIVRSIFSAYTTLRTTMTY